MHVAVPVPPEGYRQFASAHRPYCRDCELPIVNCYFEYSCPNALASMTPVDDHAGAHDHSVPRARHVEAAGAAQHVADDQVEAAPQHVDQRRRFALSGRRRKRRGKRSGLKCPGRSAGRSWRGTRRQRTAPGSGTSAWMAPVQVTSHKATKAQGTRHRSRTFAIFVFFVVPARVYAENPGS